MVDGEYVISGTPIFDVKYSDSDFSKRSDGIYMTSYYGRGHYGLDNNGDVRWALTNDVIPSFNFNLVGDDRYVSNGSTVVDNVTVSSPATNKTIYEWDIMGRVYSVTNMQYEAHHTTILVDGDSSQLLLPSEKSDYNDGSELTREDGVSIIGRATGSEVNYYDFSKLLDINRASTIINGDNRNDWTHLNAAYNDATQDLIIASLRNQNVFVGITPQDNADATISFIAGSPELEQYLLTPVNADGKALYNPEDTADIDKADKEFWT